ncbi:MAG: hypothetical protein LUG99_01975 [Lachnospiraceae bacterium]|nr:hypothetical protein [Lachnospiraceae bacterium]
MATKKTTADAETSEATATAEATTASAATVSAKTKTEKTFTLTALQKHCRELFGVPTVVFAGATAGLDTDKKYTVSEVKDIITTWCKKEVK